MVSLRQTQQKILSLTIIFVLYLLWVTPALALSISVHVPEKYTDVEIGDSIYFEVEVKYPENPERKDLRINYEIKDKEGKTVVSTQVLRAVETQASFIDNILIPKSADLGFHTIDVSIRDYANLEEKVSASFQIVKSKQEQIFFYFFIILGAVAVLGVLALINFYLHRREIKGDELHDLALE